MASVPPGVEAAEPVVIEICISSILSNTRAFVGLCECSVHEVVEFVAAVEVAATFARALLDASASVKSVSVNTAVVAVSGVGLSVVTASGSLAVGVVEVVVDVSVAAVAVDPDEGNHTSAAVFFVSLTLSWVHSCAPVLVTALFRSVAGIITCVSAALFLRVVAAIDEVSAVIEQFAVVSIAARLGVRDASLFEFAPVIVKITAVASDAFVSLVAVVLSSGAALVLNHTGLVGGAVEVSVQFVTAIGFASSSSGTANGISVSSWAPRGVRVAAFLLNGMASRLEVVVAKLHGDIVAAAPAIGLALGSSNDVFAVVALREITALIGVHASISLERAVDFGVLAADYWGSAVTCLGAPEHAIILITAVRVSTE